MRGRRPAHSRAGTPLLRGLVAIGILIVAGGCAKRPPRAHDLVFEDINPRSATHGRTLALSDLYAEQGIVLRFAASWCKSCREEMPHLQEFYAASKTPMVLVAADEGPYRENILTIAERAGLTAPLLFVPADEAEKVGKQYPYQVIPATYFIDSEGRIHESHQGELPIDSLGRVFEETLGNDQ
jgi:thiol-disulfide isomerase/thioredoxin